MTTDYFGAEKTGGSRGRIEITIDVKAEKVMDFANEIRSATIDEVLEILDGRDLWERREDGTMWTVDEELKQAILSLKGGEQE